MKRVLSPEEQDQLIKIIKARYKKNINPDLKIDWPKLEQKLLANPTKLWSLNEMELTGGEPAIVDYTTETDEYIFFDCSPETPKERRSLCYDHEALESRKTNKPKDSATNIATTMGIELLTEEQYFFLQQLGDFDTKTSSWLATPKEIRDFGGAIFGDKRFGRTFIYHNGAESYYSVRGFRGVLRV